VADALALLPERQRAAILLSHYEGLGNREIGETLGVGVEAVESLLSRGRRALRQALAAERADLMGDV
jgi:RNA polymerase sigma-70 factor (ECF subfamily)